VSFCGHNSARSKETLLEKQKLSKKLTWEKQSSLMIHPLSIGLTELIIFWAELMSSGFFRPAQDGEAQQSVSERMPSSASSPKLGSAELFESVPSSASSRKFSSVPAQLSEIFYRPGSS
jgi:hypothetical protein